MRYWLTEYEKIDMFNNSKIRALDMELGIAGTILVVRYW